LINDIKNAKDNVVGKVKETTGKLMDDQGVEFKGKLQSMKAGMGDKVEGMKEEVLGKANNVIDRVKQTKKDKD
jgi:uncharacterized protein YjbJ (UPF0337 family)